MKRLIEKWRILIAFRIYQGELPNKPRNCQKSFLFSEQLFWLCHAKVGAHHQYPQLSTTAGR
jgi:hypothetical protein